MSNINTWYNWADPSINFGLNNGITFTQGVSGELDVSNSKVPTSLDTTTSGGVYKAIAVFSISVSTGADIRVCLSQNGIPVADTDVTRSFQNTNSSGAFSITTLIDASLNDRFGIIIQTDTVGGSGPTQEITIDNISFNLTKVVGIGDTGATGATGPIGATGATGPIGATGPAIEANFAVQFWTDLSSACGTTTINPVPMGNSMELQAGGPTIIGWPILPQSMGTFYNVFGSSIFTSSPGKPIAGVPISYGEHMVYDCSIVGLSVSWMTNNTSSNYNVGVANYSTGQTDINASPNIPSGNSANNTGSFQIGSPIGVTAGDFVGIFVQSDETSPVAGNPAPSIAVLGTVYLRLH
jgi:hypothetical protein